MAIIVVIDDHEANREFLATLLAYRGYRVISARNALEGLEAVRRERPALVISDILMPGIDGFEFVRRLRHEPAIAGTEVVFCTAYFHEHEAHRLAGRCGVRHVLAKPCEPEQLLAMVEHLLTAAPPTQRGLPDLAFQQQHLRLLTDKLSEAHGDLDALHRTLPPRLHEAEQRADALRAELEAVGRLRQACELRCAVLHALLLHDEQAAMTGLLVALIQGLGMRLGVLWRVDGRSGRLRCIAAEGGSEPAYRACCAHWRASSVRLDEPLAGRCWAIGTPLWLGDAASLARLPAWPLAAAAGVHAALAFPIATGEEPLAIAELWSAEAGPPSADLLEMLSSLGRLIADALVQRVLLRTPQGAAPAH